MHAKKAKRSGSVTKRRVPVRTAASKAVRSTARRKSTGRRQWPVDPRAMVLGCVCIVALTALMAIPRMSSARRIAELEAKSQIAPIEPEGTFADVSSPADASVTKPAAVRAPKPAPAAPIEPAEPASKPLTARPVAAPSLAAPSAASASESPAATLASASANEEAEATRATITGCLAYDDDTYMLKNTSGDGAPQGRSWKSGFLKKRASSVQLLDEGQRFRLASHVGQRVETAGILIDRELRVRSMRVLGSCEA